MPNILLPNCYHKNEDLYQEWTVQIPYAKIVADTSKVQGAFEERKA